ncbi:hypothetical protein MTR_0030s0270 [Medicago truncatula]|uniref:Uncharacterized protein n=1 Tax=Medicago truncatula TaxID=3880 RepID=A0A072TIK6_MEDTR|nr:hypothetical protein MTR_0030s0270 [Medicago truncatula]
MKILLYKGVVEVVQNRIAEDCAKEVTQEAIDGPSFHRRTKEVVDRKGIIYIDLV